MLWSPVHIAFLVIMDYNACTLILSSWLFNDVKIIMYSFYRSKYTTYIKGHEDHLTVFPSM